MTKSVTSSATSSSALHNRNHQYHQLQQQQDQHSLSSLTPQQHQRRLLHTWDGLRNSTSVGSGRYYLIGTFFFTLSLLFLSTAPSLLLGRPERIKNAMFQKFVWVQSNIQARIEPSRLWRSSNSRTMRFEVTGRPEDITSSLASAVERLDKTQNPLSGNGMRWKVFKHKHGRKVTVLVLTPYWLDKASFQVHPVGENKCTLTAFARSTGVLPVVIPFSFLINTLFFWVPFTDGLGKMSKYIITRSIDEAGLNTSKL